MRHHCGGWGRVFNPGWVTLAISLRGGQVKSCLPNSTPMTLSWLESGALTPCPYMHHGLENFLPKARWESTPLVLRLQSGN